MNFPPLVSLGNFQIAAYEAAGLGVMPGGANFSAFLAVRIGGIKAAPPSLLFGNYDVLAPSGWGFFQNADTSDNPQFQLIVESSAGPEGITFSIEAAGCKDRTALLAISYDAAGAFLGTYLNGGVLEQEAPGANDFVPSAIATVLTGGPAGSFVDAAYVPTTVSGAQQGEVFRAFRTLGSLRAALQAATGGFPAYAYSAMQLRVPTLTTPDFPNGGTAADGLLTFNGLQNLTRQVDFDPDYTVANNAPPV